MRILGVDIGLKSMACCTVSVSDKTLKMTGQEFDVFCGGLLKQKDNLHPFIEANYPALDGLIANADFVCVEKPFGAQGYANILWELLGMIKLLCIINGKEYLQAPNMTLKLFATGSGKAQKSDMVKAAFKVYKIDRETEDEVDAFWCALFGHCAKMLERKCTPSYETFQIEAVQRTLSPVKKPKKKRKKNADNEG